MALGVITCALLVPFPLLFAYMISSKSMKFGDRSAIDIPEESFM